MNTSTMTNLAAGAVGGILGGLVVLSLTKKKESGTMTRLRTADPRFAGAVIRDGVVTISGQVGSIPDLESSDITAQTQQVLDKIDALLAEAGTNKSNLIEARIWVRDITTHMKPMNEVWNKVIPTHPRTHTLSLRPMQDRPTARASTRSPPIEPLTKQWVDPDNKPVRYCVEAHLAWPSILVEIQVVAQLP